MVVFTTLAGTVRQINSLNSIISQETSGLMIKKYLSLTIVDLPKALVIAIHGAVLFALLKTL